MSLSFSCQAWAAWAPGLENAADWQQWLAAPQPRPPSDDAPALAEVPAMMRRRIDRLGRMALQVAYWCQAPATANDPAPALVFASRYGDVARSVGLLGQLASAEPLSPIGFSMSVHNAIAALYSIVRADTQSYSTVAAGAETIHAAVTEALGLLADGHAQVLLVYYDEPLPAPFAHFGATEDFARAWACRLSLAQAGDGELLQLQVEPSAPDQARAHCGLPPDLEVLRFLLSHTPELQQCLGARTWRWQRRCAPSEAPHA